MSEKFKLKHNETNLSLQYYKLVRQCIKTAEERKGHLKIIATECKYDEGETRLKEKFINGIYNQLMTAEIIKDLTA